MRLLIIGTLEGHMSSAGQIALARGAKVANVTNVDDGISTLRSGHGADLAMVDIRLPVADLVKRLKDERINCPVVACGIVGTDADAAVEAIKAGAQEYIPLPPDPEMIAAVLEAVTQEASAVISSDPAMRQVLDMAKQIAPSDASVLITGHSGTGKEVMARFLHANSRRSSKVFVAVNCAAIPENLLESELFGHEKGAFTGAVARRIGKFEEADGGTLLLDEISEMHPRLQAKLLRAIQEREIDRVGGSQPVKVDVRILATSNRDLQKSVKDGDFREDLYFRLNVVNLVLPPLKDRPNDIEVLSRHFAEKYAELNGFTPQPVTSEALELLKTHDWPGNVRELENTMHRAVLLTQGRQVGPEAILLTGGQTAPSAAETASAALEITNNGEQADSQTGMVGKTVAEVERELIIDTLSHCLGNRTHAANILGISIRTLRNKLKQYSEEGFSVPMPGDAEQRAT